MGVPRKIEGLVLRSDHDRIVETLNSVHKVRMSRQFRDGAFIGSVIGGVVGAIGGILLTSYCIWLLIGG